MTLQLIGSLLALTHSLFNAIFQPNQIFSLIVPETIPSWIATALLYFAAFGLLNRPNLTLAALGGQIALGIFFQVVYFGSYRHQGLYLIFLLFLYWLLAESLNNSVVSKTRQLLFRIGLYVSMLTLILWNVAMLSNTMFIDISHERSSSMSFGEFLNKSETYQNAIIVPEPDFLLESLPYYVKNRIYFPREHRFGTTVCWTTESNLNL